MFKKNVMFLEQNGMHYLELTPNDGESLQFVGKDEEKNQYYLTDKEETRVVFNHASLEDIEKVNPDIVQVIFFFGIASIDEIIQVAQRAHSGSLFLIIEPNFSLLQYALNQEDLYKMKKMNFMIIAGGIATFKEAMEKISSSKLILLLKRPVFYFNSYYRQFEQKCILLYINKLHDIIRHRFFRIGNSIQDSLLGLVHNMVNIQRLNEYPSVSQLKNYFKSIPAFMVAAGPSLEKNMSFLKEIGNNGIIIAVDTIVEKLRKNGIKPDVIVSVERVNVWEFLIRNKTEFLGDSYLVGPPVLQTEVIEAFKGKVILPLRQSLREYRWLADLLGLGKDDKIWMGASCAHVALGFAAHIGAAPIVMVGQDLAYGNDMLTHATETIYDETPLAAEADELEVAGYYGDMVKTRPIWHDFRLLFEEFIVKEDLFVINATEGGAKIIGTHEMRLEDAILQYCKSKHRKINFNEVIDRAKRNHVNWHEVEKKLKKYVCKLEKFSKESMEQLKLLEHILDAWDKEVAQQGLEKIYQQMKKTEKFFQYIPQDELVYHNLQGPMVVLMQKFQLIENNEKEQSLKENLVVQIEFCKMFSDTLWLIAQVILENFKWTKK